MLWPSDLVDARCPSKGPVPDAASLAGGRPTSPSAVPKHGLHGLYPAPATAACSGGVAAGGAGCKEEVIGSCVLASGVVEGSDFGIDVESLAKEYAVEACVVTLQIGDRATVVAKHGLDPEVERLALETQSESGVDFFRHYLKRDLPVIIMDTTKVPRLEDHPLVGKRPRKPRIGFYVAVPIILGPFQYAGTVSICGAAPRAEFELEDCERLEQAASAVAEVVAQLKDGKV